MREAWLHRRLLKCGFPADVPLYVLTEDAFSAGCDAVYADREAVVDYAPFPSDNFAIEVSVESERARLKSPDMPLRVLLWLTQLERASTQVPFIGKPSSLEEAEHYRINGFFADNDYHTGIVWAGSFRLLSDFTAYLPWNSPEMMRDAWRVDNAVARHFGAGLKSFPDEVRERFYEEFAMLGRDWLLAACAVIATPGLPREEGRARGPEPKIRQRGATAKAPEFAYTRISLDIDRTVSGGDKAQEAEARKLALHRVRAHLRFIKDKGLVPVRSHMRGNAAHGVRIGRTLVHKGGN